MLDEFILLSKSITA